jgi:hypothetical protein
MPFHINWADDKLDYIEQTSHAQLEGSTDCQRESEVNLSSSASIHPLAPQTQMHTITHYNHAAAPSVALADPFARDRFTLCNTTTSSPLTIDRFDYGTSTRKWIEMRWVLKNG